MQHISYTYNKYQKLKSKKLVDNLFKLGKSILAFPVKIIVTVEDSIEPTVLSGVGVSKKYFKKAHDRNYIKRIIKESFRHHQQVMINFSQAKSVNIHFFILYVYKELPKFADLNEQMPTIIEKLIKYINTEKLVK